jgi:zinc transport system substrate-binding protein
VITFYLAACGCRYAPVSAVVASSLNEKLKIVAASFVSYDFARSIAGEHASIELILPFDADSHTFDPGIQELLTVKNADVFIFSGALAEPWAARLASELKTAVDLSAGISPFIENGTDPHIWLNPLHALKMVHTLTGALSKTAPDNEEYFQKNAEELHNEIARLHNDYLALFENRERVTVAFGSFFAAAHFVHIYDLNYVTVYSGCTHKAEPGARQILHVINAINEYNLNVIYGTNGSENKTARVIADETGVELLLFHPVHHISRDEMNRGETYVSLMRRNLDNIKAGLPL